MRINVIFSYYPIIYDWAVATCYCLRKLGIESDVFCPHIGEQTRDLTDGWRGNSPDCPCYIYPEADYYIIINEAEFSLKNIPSCAKTIVWSTEPIDFDHKDYEIKDKTLQLLRLRHQADFLIVHNEMIYEELRNHYVPVDAIMGIGYDEILTHYKDEPKNIDIYFEGGVNERRKNILQQFKVPITQVGAYMEQYHKNMAQAKIALNLHSYDCLTSFELERIITAVAEGALVISEEIVNSFPYINGEHVILCSSSEVVGACDYYLKNFEEAQAICEQALNHIRKNYRMEDLLYNFIVKNIDVNFKKKIKDALVPQVIL